MLALWLPLINNLNNQGLDNAVITNSGATINTSGKIGSCYSFNGSNSFISIDDSNLYNIIQGGDKPFTITFWIYHADSTRGIIFGDWGLSGNINFNIELTASHQIRFYWNGGPDKIFTDTTAEINTWVHIVLVYDGSKICIYKNGSLQTDTYASSLIKLIKTSGLFYIGRDSRTGATALNGRINDFRIYDTALSTREVKEISKGLVLHYPLSLGGGENIFKNSLNVFDSNPSRLSSTTIYNGLILNDNAPGGRYRSLDIKAENNANRGFYYLYNQTNGSLNLTENETYTVSFYIRCSKQKNMMVAPVAENQTIITYDGALYSGAANNIIVNSTWQKHYVTFKYTNTTKITTCFYLRALDEDVTFDVALPKLEVSDKATPWTPNPADDEYSIMGYDNPIEYDVSGYGNNGTKSGTFTYSSDTPRYFTSTVFENNYIVAGRIPIKDELTYSWWAYSDNWGSSLGGSMVSSIESGGMGHQKPLNFACGTGTTSNNYGQIYSMPTPSAGWHMFTETWDGYSFKVYLDGELKNTNTRYTEKTPVFYNANYNVLFIGGESATSQTVAADRFIGKLSDVRVYATALSAEDIQLLYNATISLSNSGTLLTQGELSEV